jgi:hypothetical protein
LSATTMLDELAAAGEHAELGQFQSIDLTQGKELSEGELLSAVKFLAEAGLIEGMAVNPEDPNGENVGLAVKDGVGGVIILMLTRPQVIAIAALFMLSMEGKAKEMVGTLLEKASLDADSAPADPQALLAALAAGAGGHSPFTGGSGGYSPEGPGGGGYL